MKEAIDDYRVQLGDDLNRLDGAVQYDLPDDAVDVMQEHIHALERMHTRLDKIVAGAVVEREAEAVLDDINAGWTGDDPSTSAGRGVTPGRSGHVRRGLAAAAAMLSLAVLANQAWSPGPQDPLLVAVAASEEALAAAAAAQSGSPHSVADLTALSVSLHNAIMALPPDMRRDPQVRQWISDALTEQQAALVQLVDSVPAVAALLADLALLAQQLGVVLPPGTPMSTGEVRVVEGATPLAQGQSGSVATAPGHQVAPRTSRPDIPVAPPVFGGQPPVGPVGSSPLVEHGGDAGGAPPTPAPDQQAENGQDTTPAGSPSGEGAPPDRPADEPAGEDGGSDTADDPSKQPIGPGLDQLPGSTPPGSVDGEGGDPSMSDGLGAQP